MTTDITNTPWRQLNLTCTDWQAAERMAVTHLGPLLAFTEATGAVFDWWYVRKGDTWRVRLRARIGSTSELDAILTRMTTTLIAESLIVDANDVIYEPETAAFGGTAAMTAAHTLFHADSHHVLSHAARTDQDHRRELCLVLATRLMTAAGQDRYEQGDIWTQVAAHRDPPEGTEPLSETTLADLRRLITASADSPSSPLRSAPGWSAAFCAAGEALANLAARGELTRGLRAVLAHHILFTFNRHGVSGVDQYRLATAASQILLDERLAPAPAATAATDGQQTTTVNAVTRDLTTTTSTDYRSLQDALADDIRRRKVFRTRQVEDAFRSVPRHMFLPGVALTTAYENKPVVTKRAADGSSISSASSPMLVASMLEQLDVQPGHRVLEIGAATGFNAALLAHLAGPTGHVVTIEYDGDLIDGARTAVELAGYPDAQVICGDGALGHPDGAPYDRIIVTAEAWDIVPAWWQQLAIGGRLVLPLRLHGSGLTRALAFTRDEPDRMTATSAEVCGFVPMRGSAEHTGIHVALADDIAFKVDADDLPDAELLADALTYPAQAIWTGVHVHDDEPAHHLDLWLLTTGTDRFGRLSIEPKARVRGAVDPARRWGGASFYIDGTIAYLAARPISDDTDELGVIAHGPGCVELSSRTAELLHRWNKERPGQPTTIAHRAEGIGSAEARIVRAESTFRVEWADRDRSAVA